jgi:hypothetical protein
MHAVRGSLDLVVVEAASIVADERLNAELIARVHQLTRSVLPEAAFLAQNQHGTVQRTDAAGP